MAIFGSKNKELEAARKRTFAFGVAGGSLGVLRGMASRSKHLGARKLLLGKASLGVGLGVGISRLYSQIKQVKTNKSTDAAKALEFGKAVGLDIGGALAGGFALALGLHGSTKILRPLARSVASRRAAKAAIPRLTGLKNVTPKKGKVIFRRIRGRIIPIRKR